MKKITFILFLVSLALGSAIIVSCASSKTQGENDGKISSVGELSVAPGGKVDAPRFLGGVYIKNLVKDGEAGKFPATNLIVFEPKARSAWHSHGGMILLITDGVGYYQEEGKPAQILRKGDVFEIPEGVRHWHGAHDDGKIEFVSDSEYENLKEEEYSGRAKKWFGSQMFSRAEKGVKLPTFTGTAYVNDLLPDENSAKCPGLHYVVFEPCVINSWHVHEGGQILIATDGTGYHQIEGEQVQVMRPGEVAVCPPGKKHWHGGSSSSAFAHIAANLYTEKKGVQWFDLISDEEYKTIEKENFGGHSK
ncbi:MAG: cupin domain-containing protein [Treponema sp.]